VNGAMLLTGWNKKLSELNNMKKKRLEALRRRNKDCYDAILWLRANKDKFKSIVHEPLILTVREQH